MQQLNYMDNNTSKKQKINNGRWTHAQHRKFMDALDKYGRDWVKIQKKLKTRTALQIRSHAQKVFLKMSKQDIDAFIGSDDQSSVKPKKIVIKTAYHPCPIHMPQISDDQKQNLDKLKKEIKEQNQITDSFIQKIENDVKRQDDYEIRQNLPKKQPKVAVVREISQNIDHPPQINAPNYSGLLVEALKEQERLLIQSLNIKRLIQTLSICSNPLLFPFNRNL